MQIKMTRNDPFFDVTLDRCNFCGSVNDVISIGRMRRACPSCRTKLAMMCGPEWERLSKSQKVEVYRELFGVIS